MSKTVSLLVKQFHSASHWQTVLNQLKHVNPMGFIVFLLLSPTEN